MVAGCKDWPCASTQPPRPNAVWVGGTGGERASRVRVWASRPNHWWNHSVWETGFRRDAENGNRDGRAPQQKPSCAAKGSLGWTTIEESGRTGGIGKKLLK